MATKRTNGSEAGYNADDGADDEVIISADGSTSRDDDETGSIGIPIVEPTTINYEPDSSERAPKRRGRTPGSRNASKTARKETAQDLTLLMMGLHSMGAALLKIPELELEQSEAKRLGDAVARVNAEYGGIMLSPKGAAWLGLTMAMGEVYGPRFLAAKINADKKKKEKTVTVM